MGNGLVVTRVSGEMGREEVDRRKKFKLFLQLKKLIN